MSEESVRIIPLGGLGEIGQNMMLLEYGDDCIVIDCGLMFPESHMLGVDVVIPDFKYLLESKKNIKAILITHGHEDHIGALPYLLRELKEFPPIYASPFAKELILHKLKDTFLSDIEINTAVEAEVLELGVFKVEFFETVHSIIDSMALFIETPVGNIFHSGDFKFDPYYKEHETKMEKIGKRGIHLLLADSTNVERKGHSLSEKDVKTNFDTIFSQEKGRIFISSFASNLRRVNNLLELAKKHGRKVYLDGRSMLAYTHIARELGFLKNTDIITDEITDDENYLFIITGSQAEPYASLTRLAYKTHGNIKLKPEDLVILSSRFIPGNERAIQKLMNHVCLQGARILYGEISDIHTSGHAHSDELRKLHNYMEPQFFIPVHGEYRHLVMHAALAQENMPKENTVVAKNGDIVELTKDSMKKNGALETSPVFVDSIAGDDLENAILRDRRHLSEKGIIFVVIIRNEDTGEVIEGPHFHSKGFLSEEKHEKLFEKAKDVALKIINKNKTPEEIQEDVRVGVRRFFKSKNLKRPLVLPIVLDL